MLVFENTKSSLSDATTILHELGHFQLVEEITSFQRITSDASLRIAVFGEYSVGKSTLLNAFLKKHLLTANLRPTTGVPTEIRKGTGADTAKIIFRDGRQESASLVEANDYSNLSVENRARDEIERIIISTNSNILANNITFIDTPGVLDDQKQTERTKQEIASADIVILVLRADHLFSQTEQDFAVNWLTKDLAKPVVPVVNFMSRIDSGDRKELRDLLDRFTRNLNIPFNKQWFEIDALPALRFQLQIDNVAMPSDDYFIFSEMLETLPIQRGDDLKFHSRTCWQASLKRRAKLINTQTLSKLEHENLKVLEKRDQQIKSYEGMLNRIRQNVKGELIGCLDKIEQYKTGRSLALSKSFSSTKYLKDDEQSRAAIYYISQAFESALSTIDKNANDALNRLSFGTDIVLAPISVREIVALRLPPTTDIMPTKVANGMIWATMLGGLAIPLTGGLGIVAAALFGFMFGSRNAKVSEQIEKFKSELCQKSDLNLEKLKPLLSDQFTARVNQLCEALEIRIRAIETLPLPEQELVLRKKLHELL